MRAEVITGYNRRSNEKYSHEYPYIMINVIAEPTNEFESRVASYVDVSDMSNRETRFFRREITARNELAKKVLKLIRTTRLRGIVS